jgi:hypothetical protein
MNRCTQLLGAALLGVCLATPVGAQPATDQFQRTFPEQARRGVFKVVSHPIVQLNGQQEQLSPGARIRDTHNLIVMPNTLVGQELRVNYTREATGLVHDVWILTPAEAAQQRAGNHDYVQRNFKFSSEP